MEADSLFYDSLEDEDAPELLPLRSTPTSSDISLTIPLYAKETSKRELLSQKSQNFEHSQHRSRPRLKLPSIASSQTQLRAKSTASAGSLSQLVLESRKKKSYVDLFHARIGYVQGSESMATETSRAICDDDSFKTARSSITSEYSDAAETSSLVSDTSFYTKFLENERLLANQVKTVRCRSEGNRLGQGNSKSNSTFTDFTASSMNLSISAVSVQRAKGKTRNGKRFDRDILKVPTLGGLGPDREACREKLDKLKRQQKYGQKVSNQNRVKIMEMKVMKNFKYELKKSSELNKCAESVLGS